MRSSGVGEVLYGFLENPISASGSYGLGCLDVYLSEITKHL